MSDATPPPVVPPAADPYRDRWLPIVSWAMYDFANTIFSAVVVTQFLPKVLRRITEMDTPMAVAGAVSLIIAAILGPFLGAFSDATGRTKSQVILWTTLCCGAAAAMSLAPGDSAAWLLVLFVLANISYNVGISLYDSFLPDLCSPHRMGFVSGVGVGVGYLGALLGYPLALWVSKVWGDHATFAAAAGLMALFSLPFVFFVRERSTSSPQKFTAALGLREMRSTLETLRGLPGRPALALFLIANFLAVDSLNAMIQWVAQFFREGWGITDENVVTSMLIRLSIAAVIAGFVAGRAADLFGAGRVFAAATLSLLIVTLVDAFGTNPDIALHVTVWCGGFGAAGVWLAGRRVLVDLVPADRLAQHMGLLGITRKASVIGTLLLAGLADTLGWRTAIGALAVPLALALVFLALGARRGTDDKLQTLSKQ